MLNMLLQASAFQGLAFTTENLSESLICSIAGMAGIFIVVGIINKIGAVKNLTFFTAHFHCNIA